jgi:hypothetical protein
MKTLFFNLKKEPFDVMVTGEKTVEYRNISKHWNSRLLNKDGSFKEFDLIKFQHAYNSNNPYFICEFKGIEKVKDVDITYSNGFKVNFSDEKWGIKLGKIVEKGNL